MGYGSRWGTNWGYSRASGIIPPTPPSVFASPLYPIPIGTRLGSIPIREFSGEPASGSLSGFSGVVFFSPAMLQQNNTNQIDLDDISVAARVSDSYEQPEERESRVFRFSNSGTHKTNDPSHRTQPEYAVIAVLVQTTPPGPTTFIKIP